MPNLRERKKADTRTRLSAAAVELLVAEGAERATVSAIAQRAGVSTRTFHNYFAHREDAFVHFMREQIAEWVRQVEQAPEESSPLDVLRGTFHELYSRPDDDIDTAQNLLVAGEQIGLLLSTEARSRVAEDILDPLYEAVGRRIPGPDPFLVRVLVDLSLAAGAAVLRHRPGGARPETGGPDTAGSPESYLDAAFDLLENGAGSLLRGGGQR